MANRARRRIQANFFDALTAGHGFAEEDLFGSGPLQPDEESVFKPDLTPSIPSANGSVSPARVKELEELIEQKRSER